MSMQKSIRDMFSKYANTDDAKLNFPSAPMFFNPGTIEKMADLDKDKTPDDEWIWVDGYKATNADMKCKGHQYNFNCHYEMPAENVVECSSGYHLCLNLADVFSYYSVGNNHRFFKVRALVRKKDVDGYRNRTGMRDYFLFGRNDKLVSKSITFLEELTPDEVLKATGTDISDWTEEEMKLAMQEGVEKVINNHAIERITAFGYSRELAKYIVDSNKRNIAELLETQPGLSMDTKVRILFRA